MYSTDFVYDDEYLSDFGFMICDFDSTTGVNAISRGSEIAFNTIPISGGKTYKLISTNYENCLEFSFDICKDPDLRGNDYYDRIVSEYEYDKIVKWLNRKQFFTLSFKNGYDRNCYFNASFNIENIYIRDILYGFRLTATTDRPYGFGDEVQETIEFTESDECCVIKNCTDETGYTNPKLEITFKTVSGDLTLINESYQSGYPLIVKNCSIGETVTIDCENQIITSTKDGHNVCNDFNFRFLKLGKSYRNNENKIRVSLPCTLSITYTPIIKTII